MQQAAPSKAAHQPHKGEDVWGQDSWKDVYGTKTWRRLNPAHPQRPWSQTAVYGPEQLKAKQKLCFFFFLVIALGIYLGTKKKVYWPGTTAHPPPKKQHNSQVTNGNEGRGSPNLFTLHSRLVCSHMSLAVVNDSRKYLSQGWWLSFCLALEGISRQLGKESEARLTLMVQSSLNKAPKPQLEKKIKILFAEPTNIFSVVSNLAFIFKKFTKKTSTLTRVEEKFCRSKL